MGGTIGGGGDGEGGGREETGVEKAGRKNTVGEKPVRKYRHLFFKVDVVNIIQTLNKEMTDDIR